MALNQRTLPVVREDVRQRDNTDRVPTMASATPGQASSASRGSGDDDLPPLSKQDALG